MHPFPQGICPLPDWGVLEASGPDATAFLQAQLTQSVSDLSETQARLGGYCNAKGRLLANFILLREGPETVCLLLPLELLAALQKKLSMFVLRAKVKLQDASSRMPLYGVVGDAVPADLAVWQRAMSWIRLPDAQGQRRALHLGAAGPTELPRAAWDWLEVQAGVPWLRAATSEHFVPQMINWELLGGVNFQKGCYPGQEVVARSQYRGTVKRRVQLLQGGTAPPATELHGPEGAVGEVLAAARWGDDAALLAEVQLAVWDSDAPLQLPDGTALTRAALPYPVKAPE